MRAYDVVAWAIDGDIYCADCASEGAAPVFAENEADVPQHCGTCHEYIPGDLTDCGRGYVREAVADAIRRGDVAGVALTTWADLVLRWGVVERCQARAEWRKARGAR